MKIIMNKCTLNILGVHYKKDINRWTARLTYNKKRLGLGNFLTELEAVESIHNKRKELGLPSLDNTHLNDLDGELWNPINRLSTKYLVSNMGRVKSNTRGKCIILKPFYPSGYAAVRIGRLTRAIHLLVAEVFLNHITDGKQTLVVDHINNNKLDNRLENLQLISQRENCSKDSVNIGATLHKKSGRYFARIYIKGEHRYLGYFSTAEEASARYHQELETIKTNKYE